MDIQEYIQSGIIESYVLGLASSEESAEVEQLLLQYPEVSVAIDDFSGMLETQLQQDTTAPPANIKDKIMAAIQQDTTVIGNVAPFNAETTSQTDVKHLAPVRSIRKFQTVAAAAVVLLIASAALNFYLYDQYKTRNGDYQALLIQRNTLQANNTIFETRLQQWKTVEDVMSDTAMTIVRMPGIAGKKENFATVFWNATNSEVYLIPNKLPPAAAGKQYQLWALVNGKPVDAGVLDPTCTGACRMKHIPRAQAFAITLEKEGGSDAPTMTAMYVLGKV